LLHISICFVSRVNNGRSPALVFTGKTMNQILTDLEAGCALLAAPGVHDAANAV
jgi:hypothetical protein